MTKASDLAARLAQRRPKRLLALDAIGVNLPAQQILEIQNISGVDAIPHLLEVCSRPGRAVSETHFPTSIDAGNP
jgi:hypothetical protein